MDSFKATAVASRRILIEHTRGPYAGLRRIVGTEDQVADQWVPPVYVSGIVGLKTGTAHLVEITDRVVRYLECEKGTVHENRPVG